MQRHEAKQPTEATETLPQELAAQFEALERFVEAQKPAMETVLEELVVGRKETHWMWFVFPQLRGLGHSPKARKYGVQDLQEARAYLSHPILGPRLHECFKLVLLHRGKPAVEIFGAIDAVKFRSCATLFDQAAASEHSVFALALRAFFGGQPDPLTLELL